MEYGRNNSDPPTGPPLPGLGDKYVVFGILPGVVVGGLLGTALHFGSAFLTVAADAFVGAFIGTLAGDRFKKRKSNKVIRRAPA